MNLDSGQEKMQKIEGRTTNFQGMLFPAYSWLPKMFPHWSPHELRLDPEVTREVCPRKMNHRRSRLASSVKA